MGGGEFFSQELGTLLRMRYNTESYGQERYGESRAEDRRGS